MQRAAVASGLQIAVGLRGLREREILGQRHHAVERLAVLLEPRQVHLREVGRRHPPSPDERRQDGDRLEREIVETRGHADRGRLAAIAQRARFEWTALADACPAGYGRNVIAGSVSSGMSSWRSVSKLSRFRTAPGSAISSSASVKWRPITCSADFSESLRSAGGERSGSTVGCAVRRHGRRRRRRDASGPTAATAAGTPLRKRAASHASGVASDVVSWSSSHQSRR